MLEIETKYRVSDFVHLEQQLQTLGAAPVASETHRDHYYNAPDRDFVRTGEAFRLRSLDDTNYFTYKGPRREGKTKTRPEHEVALGNGLEQRTALEQLLQLLGYRSVGVLQKTRQVYTLERASFVLHICCDRVDGLGRFVELEILTAEAQLASAEQVLFQLANDLGLQDRDRETRSYLTLWFEQHREADR